MWKLQDAKNRFSELVEKARKNGPQVVTRRGKKVVVVVSVEDYEKLRSPDTDLVAFFASSPLKGAELDLERSKEEAREIEL
jgi:prevent-host-death family protein